MTTTPSPYEGLTVDELETLVAESEQHAGEDSTAWAARAARQEADYRTLAETRRARVVAEDAAAAEDQAAATAASAAEAAAAAVAAANAQ